MHGIISCSHISFPLKDPALIPLVVSVCTALIKGCFHGHMKGVVEGIIMLIRQNGLGPEHNLALSVCFI